jgi:hypothetical protein
MLIVHDPAGRALDLQQRWPNAQCLTIIPPPARAKLPRETYPSDFRGVSFAGEFGLNRVPPTLRSSAPTSWMD